MVEGLVARSLACDEVQGGDTHAMGAAEPLAHPARRPALNSWRSAPCVTPQCCLNESERKVKHCSDGGPCCVSSGDRRNLLTAWR